jgi:hypothetical protein
MAKKALFLFLVIHLGVVQNTWSQSRRLDLDDLMIKGELHSDDRLLILSRQRNELKNFVQFRENYREEILQELPETGNKRNYRPRR